jgi:glycosyltransferase involved in cell wall biosynthesis
MNNISVVIIAKNEEENIAECIASAMQISNDIIVADSGSTDATQALAVQAGARLIQTEWKGYGQTRNEAAKTAVNDWVLALDADERVTAELAKSINSLPLNDDSVLFGFERKSFLITKKIKYGEWGRDKVHRLYNRKWATWDLQPVHENIIGNNISRKIIPGSLLHYTMKDLNVYRAKTILYAQLSARKYAAQGKKATIIKRFVSPVFSFVQNYIFRLGFLDGREGLIIASASSKYVYLKYRYLHSLLKKVRKP